MNDDPSLKMNPLLAPWTGRFEAPPFDRIKPCHFVEAFKTALGLAQAEIADIAANPERPPFENTIVVLESGLLLKRISSVFSILQLPIPITRLKQPNARSLQNSPGIVAAST
jgi:Zn-dependent oligopeptidase